ncbi:proton-conducting transporter membrane subunit, partial [Nitrospirota bacterium]
MVKPKHVARALFLSIGIIYERSHTRKIADYGGLATVTPIYAAMFIIFTLASIGFPGMNGFVGEFLIILGGFAANKWAGVLAATGIIIGACYMLWLYQR